MPDSTADTLASWTVDLNGTPIVLELVVALEPLYALAAGAVQETTLIPQLRARLQDPPAAPAEAGS